MEGENYVIEKKTLCSQKSSDFSPWLFCQGFPRQSQNRRQASAFKPRLKPEGFCDFCVVVLILGIFFVSWSFEFDLFNTLGKVSLSFEPTYEGELSSILSDASGTALANVSLQFKSGLHVAPGSMVIFNVTITTLSALSQDSFLFIYELVNSNTNQSFLRKDEHVATNASLVLVKEIRLPEIIPEGNYLFLVNVSNSNGSVLLYTPLAIEKEIGTVGFGEHVSFFMSILVVVFIIFIGLYYVFWLRRDLIKKKFEDKQKNSVYPFPDFLTLPQSKYAYVGLVADTDEKVYLDHTQLNRHTLIAGGTGSGKTVAGMVIAEELLKRGVPVLVFDPVGQWSGFAKPNGEERMRKRFKKFGLGVPRAFTPRVIDITEATMNVDVMHYLKLSGLTVLRMDKLTPRKADEFIESALVQIYRANLSESGSLKSLVVLDEVHRLLPKYGGRHAYIKLEQAVREFRKWGIGLLMISQVLTDFKGAIRGNIGTEIQVHTRYEGDIKRVRERHGTGVSNLISKLPTGFAMVECANYNKGNPYFVEFRPVLHSPYKLSEAEMKLLVKHETPVLRARIYSVEHK